MKKESNEIDLLELLAKIYFLFKRNKYIILAFAVIGIITGIYKASKTESYYQTEMIVKTALEPEVVYNQLQILSDFRSSNNIALLAEELNITKGNAQQIKSIKIEEIEEIEESSLIKIVLEAHSTNIIPKIKRGIVNYTKSNKYLNEQLQTKQKHYKQYLNEISEALEILRKKENKKNGSENPNEIIIGEEGYAGQIIQLMDKKEKVETNLSQNKPLNIIKNFHIPENKRRDTTINIALYFAIGLFLGILVVIGLFLIRKFESFNKN